MGRAGVPASDVLDDFIRDLDMPRTIRETGVEEDDLPRLAEDAMKVQRLLVNNPREMTLDAARACYEAVL